eukprot:TRINITY_DN3188_c0_g1_i1.p1 TRINITY_DN3188_c0_g1~~TRINITY_DN3188_c0_g1_i1.p1  ORF type:complete len:298 (-),score=44.88 TRINITY_DN3188_c0_g1_i1:774-1607(-)
MRLQRFHQDSNPIPNQPSKQANKPIKIRKWNASLKQEYSPTDIGDANLHFRGDIKWGQFETIADLPNFGVPEISLYGRSNVGKSSLLNAMVGKKVARSGKTPGRTQALHSFIVGNKFALIDLPGYGYARVSKEERAKMTKLLEEYIQSRSQIALRSICILIDSRREITASEIEMMNSFNQLKRMFAVILTKTDKVKPPILEKKVASIESLLDKKYSFAYPEVFPTSSLDPTSLNRLRAFLISTCGSEGKFLTIDDAEYYQIKSPEKVKRVYKKANKP